MLSFQYSIGQSAVICGNLYINGSEFVESRLDTPASKITQLGSLHSSLNPLEIRFYRIPSKDVNHEWQGHAIYVLQCSGDSVSATAYVYNKLLRNVIQRSIKIENESWRQTLQTLRDAHLFSLPDIWELLACLNKEKVPFAAIGGHGQDGYLVQVKLGTKFRQFNISLRTLGRASPVIIPEFDYMQTILKTIFKVFNLQVL